MKQKTIFFILTLLYFLPAQAIEGRLIITTHPDFYYRWYKTVSDNPMANIAATNQVYNQQVFYMLPLVSGFARDKKGKANVTYTLTIRNNGKIVYTKNNVKGLTKAVNDTTAVFLCETVLNFEFKDTTPKGELALDIELLLTDNIAKKSGVLSEGLTVNKYDYHERPFTSNDSFFVWQNYYYENIEPDREIDGLRYFSNPQLQTRPEATLAMLAFFTDVFKNKPYLLKRLETLFATSSKDERLLMIQVLHLCNHMPATFQKKLTLEEKTYYNDLKGYGLPIIPDSTVKNPVLLNLLWSHFFATGEYKYAKKIVEALELVKYEGALERYQESQKGEKEQQEAFWETVYQKNIQDLLQRLPNHPLFNGYCLYMITTKNEVLPVVAKELERVVVR